MSANTITVNGTATITVSNAVGAVTYIVAQPTVAEISGTTVTGKQAGKMNITVSAAGDGNHNAATTTVELTVVAQPVVAESIADCEVAFTGGPYTYTGSAITPELTVKFSLSINTNRTTQDSVHKNTSCLAFFLSQY